MDDITKFNIKQRIEEKLDEILKYPHIHDKRTWVIDNIAKNTKNVENDFSFHTSTFQENGFVPDEFKDEFDLFQHYYDMMCKTKKICVVIDDIDRYFNKNKYTMHGCNFSCDGMTVNHSCYFDTFIPPDVYNGSNPEFPNSSKLVDLQCKDGNSRVVAVENIREGDVIISESALIQCKINNCVCVNSASYECYYCSLPIRTFVCCKTCNIVVYCSFGCRDKADKEYHEWECRAVKTHFFNRGDKMHLALRMVFFGAQSNFNLSSPNSDYKKIYNMTYKLWMMTKKQLHFLLRRVLQILLYLIKYTTFFVHLTKQNMLPYCKTLEQRYIQIGAFLIRHYCQAVFNAVYFPEEDFSFIVETNATLLNSPAICISTSKIRHSCTPNTYTILRKKYSVVRACKDIVKGEEITMSFCGFDETLNFKSRSTILKNRHIKCRCTKCLDERRKQYNSNFIFKCPICLGPLKYNYRICIKCGETVDMDIFEQRKMAFEDLFNTLKRLDIASPKALEDFLWLHNSIFYTINEEVLDISLNLMKKSLLTGNAVFQCGSIFLHILENALNKHSMTIIYSLTYLANNILIYGLTNSNPDEVIMNFLDTVMMKLAECSNHYYFKSQMEKLIYVYDRVQNLCHKSTKTSEDNKKVTKTKNLQ